MKKAILFSLLFLCYGIAQAQLSVTAAAINATCQANGAVQAHTLGGTAPYNFVLLDAANQVVKPGQADSLFQNLAPGSYKVAVYDAVNTVTPVVSALSNLTSSYLGMAVSFALGSTSPLTLACTASSTAGYLSVSFTNGRAPFTVSILSGPTTVTPVVTSNHNAYLTGLSTGTYVVSIADSCGNTVSTGNISVYGTSNAYPASILSLASSVSFYSQSGTVCGPQAYLSPTSPVSNPLRWFLEYPAGSGVYTDTFLSGSFSALPYINPALLNGASYRLFVQHPCTGVWQNGLQALPSMVPFTPSYDANSGLYVNNNCDSITPYVQTGMMSSIDALKFYCYPLHVTITDSVNPAIKPLDTLITVPGSALNYNSYAMPASGTYFVTLTDAQGNVYRKSITVQAQPPKRVSVQLAVVSGCNASTLGFSVYGVAPGNVFPVTFNLVSATGVTDPSVYPPIVVNSTTATNQAIQLWNNIPAAAGTLRFEVVFNCRRDTMSVAMSKFRYAAAKLDSFSFRIGSAGCSAGKADLLLNAHVTDTAGVVTPILSNSFNSYPFLLRILPSGTTNYMNGFNQMVFSALSPGTYKIGIAPSSTAFVNTPSVCAYWDTLTVVIPSFTAPVIDANKTFGMVCPGNTTGQLQVVASGYTPFQYRMKASGSPSYGSWQPSNLFSGLSEGNYDVQVQDGCNAISSQTAAVVLAGNGAVINTSGVTSNTVPEGSAAQLQFSSVGPSSGTTWTTPGNVTYNGDTLNIASFSIADSGMYYVQATSALGCQLRDSILLRPSAPLPLELLLFSGKVDGSQDLLEWKTAATAQITRFGIEYSKNGNDFSPVGQIEVTEKAAASGDYHFSRKGQDGRFYYRLKMTDRTGACSYSPVLTMVRYSGSTMTILNAAYPIPFGDVLHLNIGVTAETDGIITLLDITGRKLVEKQLNLSKGNQEYTLEGLGRLSSGTYFISVKAGAGDPVVRKVVK